MPGACWDTGVTGRGLRAMCHVLIFSAPSGSDQAEGLKRKWCGSRTTAKVPGSLILKKVNRNSRTAYYPSVTEVNNKNPRFVFGAVARLGRNFMSFFTDKIKTLRGK